MSLGVSGCMSKQQGNSKPSPEVIKEKVETYLQDKYGEEFAPLSFSGSNWAYGYNKMYWYPKNESEADRFEVQIVINKDGSFQIKDAYFGKIIASEYAKVVSGFVGEIYKDFEFFIRFGEGVYSDKLNKDTTIEEIYNKEDLFVSYSTVFVKEDSAKGIDTLESLKKIAAKMIEKKLVGDVQIYVVKNEKFDSITLDALNNNSEYFLDDYRIVMIGKDLEILALE